MTLNRFVTIKHFNRSIINDQYNEDYVIVKICYFFANTTLVWAQVQVIFKLY